MVLIKVTRNEREDILRALRLWVKDHGINMVGNSKADLEALIEKVDCAGEDDGK